MRRLAWTFAARIGDKYQIRLTRSIYTDWQKKRYNQNQSCFIQAVISSNYVETNETKNTRSIMFWRNLKLYEVVPSNWRKLWPKFDVTDATFELEFPEDLDTNKELIDLRKIICLRKFEPLAFQISTGMYDENLRSMTYIACHCWNGMTP